MFNTTTFSIITLVILAALAYALNLKSNKSNTSASDKTKYKPKNLLTANELEFITRLEQACPEYRFHAQVCMAAIMEPDLPRSEKGPYYSARGKIAQKMVDYVVQDRNTGNIIALIELDDKTHNPDKDTQRDAITQSAGYKTIRWNSKNKPSAEQIRKELV